MLIETISAASSFILLHITSHPASKFRKNAKLIKIKRLEIYPCLRLHLQTRVIHIHHWVYWSALLIISIPTNFKILDLNSVQAIMLGAFLQGFTINKKARKLVYSTPLENSDEYR